jgi:hypothetical protein
MRVNLRRLLDLASSGYTMFARVKAVYASVPIVDPSFVLSIWPVTSRTIKISFARSLIWLPSPRLEKFPLIPDDEPIHHPTTVVAPFPFLEIHNGFHCSFCHFACVSRKHMLVHGNTQHGGQMHLPVKARFKSGPVQRFFKSQSGSSYFQVDPLLSDVPEGSDFDVFYSMVQMERKAVQNSARGISADMSDEVDWDLSPFLAWAGCILEDDASEAG